MIQENQEELQKLKDSLEQVDVVNKNIQYIEEYKAQIKIILHNRMVL